MLKYALIALAIHVVSIPMSAADLPVSSSSAVVRGSDNTRAEEAAFVEMLITPPERSLDGRSFPFVSVSQEPVEVFVSADKADSPFMCVCRSNCDPIDWTCRGQAFGCVYEDPFVCVGCSC